MELAEATLIARVVLCVTKDSVEIHRVQLIQVVDVEGHQPQHQPQQGHQLPLQHNQLFPTLESIGQQLADLVLEYL